MSAKTRTALLLLMFMPVFCHAGILVEKAVAGLDGYVRGERWIPVTIDFRNTGGAFQGRLDIERGDTIFRKTLDLGQGARKRVEILVQETNYYEDIKYGIFDSKNHLIHEDRIDTRVLNYQDNMILVVSDTDYNHQFLNGVQNPWGGKTFVAYMKSRDLFEEPLAYSTADAIAIGNISPQEIPPATWKALMLYAASGGTIICSSATSLGVLQTPEFQATLPHISPELTIVSKGEFLLPRWTAKTSDAFPLMAIPAQRLVPRPSDLSLAAIDPTSALTTSSPYYKGNFVYFAYDYTVIPEQIRTVFAGYWNELIYPSKPSPPAFGGPGRQRLEDNPRAQRFLYDIPGLNLPDVKWFALFFFVYLIAIGPLQYFILSRMKKNALLWTTFPLIIFVFTGAALGYSKIRQKGENRIRHVAVWEVFPSLETMNTYQSYGTAFSKSGDFDFTAVPENSYMTKAARQTFTGKPEPYILSEDLPHGLIGEVMKTWTYRNFDAISSEHASTPVRAQVAIDGDTLAGNVTNSSPYTIEDAFFLYDSRNAATIGTLSPGTTKSFSVKLDNSSRPPIALDHMINLLNLRSESHSFPHFFFGEIHSGQGEIIINGKKTATECYRYIAVYMQIHEAGPANEWNTSEYSTMPYRY